MFGGLEIKGASAKDDDKGNDAMGTSTAAAPSAFSFMNVAPSRGEETPAELAPAAMSSFAFLNAAPVEGANEPETTTSTTTGSAAVSAFDFMQTPASSTPAASEPSQVESSPSPALGMSGFSFLNPSPPEQDSSGGDAARVLKTLEPLPAKDASSETPSAPAQSAFSFMTSPAETATANATSAPSASSSSMPSTESVLPDLSQPALTSSSPVPPPMTSESPTPLSASPLPVQASAPPSTSAVPAGSGVVFAAPPTGVKKVIKKRKGRAQRVGMGATAAPSNLSVPSPAAKPPLPQQLQEDSSENTRDAAAEAAKRAEEFMNQKAMEQAKQQEQQQTQQQPPPPQRVRSYGSNDSEDIPPIMPSASTDEVVAAAQKAAVEAQAQMAQKTSSLGGRIMGGIFKGFGGGSGHASIGSISSTGSGANAGRRTGSPSATSAMSKAKAAPPLPAPAPIASVPSAATAPKGMTTVQPEAKKFEPPPTATAAAGTPVCGFQPPAPTPTLLSSFQATTPPTGIALPASTAAPPPKVQTPIDVMNDLLAKFSVSVTNAMSQVSTVRAQRKLLLEERFVALAKERLATQQISQAETQLQTAAEEEDYELADQLGQVIQAHENERAEVTRFLQVIAEKLEQLESTKRVVIGGVASCFETVHTQLVDLKEEQTSQETKDDSEAMKQFSTISKQLSIEHERLQQDLKHLERDESLVAEERKELEDAISEQSGVYEKQRDDTKDQIEQNEAEMEELRKQLKLKQDETARLRSDLYGCEDSISKVRVKFNRQLNRVSKKETSLAENRRDWEFEHAGYERQKEAHELQVQTHSQALIAREKFVRSISSEVNLAEEWTAMVQSQLDFCEDDEGDGNSQKGEATNGEGDDGANGTSTSSLAQMQATVVKWEAAVSDAKVKLRAATTALENLEREHESLVGRLPELEQTKKEAAAKRDFKAASKASKEIKDFKARLDIVAQELAGDASQRKESAEEELKELDAKLVEAKRAAQEQEQIASKAKMTQLALKLAALHNLVKQRKQHHAQENGKVEKDGSGTGDSPSGGDKQSNESTSPPQNSVNEIGVQVLEAQIRALTQEGESLGEKFGGWEQLIREHLPRDVPSKDNEAGTALEIVPATASADSNNESEVSSPAKQDDEKLPSAAPSPAMTKEERVAKVKQLMQRIAEAEQALEDAVSQEDYDRAAELDTVFQDLKNELEAMDLTPEETELALSDSVATPDAPESSAPTDVTPAPFEEETDNDEVPAVESTQDLPTNENSEEKPLKSAESDDIEEMDGGQQPIESASSIEESEQQEQPMVDAETAESEENPLPHNSGNDETNDHAFPCQRSPTVDGVEGDDDVLEDKVVASGSVDGGEVDKEEKQDHPIQ